MSTEQPLISVIVPVYNVVRYLDECVRSIVEQSYRNLEIILVDDGSTDASGRLCDKWKARDTRIAVYHKHNGGLSDARNYGLKRCHGAWISFVDSDDFLSPIFIEVLMLAAQNFGCSVVAVPFGKQFRDGTHCLLSMDVSSLPLPQMISSDEAQKRLLYQQMDTGAPWRLYRREILGSDPFPKGIYYEDLATVYKILHRVSAVAVVDTTYLYAYRTRPNSIIHQSYRHIKGESALKISKTLYQDICRWYPQLAAAAASRCFSLCRMVFAQIPLDSHSKEMVHDRTALWHVLRSFAWTIVCDPHARKRERLAAAIAVMGKYPFTLFCKACRKVGLLR